jgi:hypothetical protein
MKEDQKERRAEHPAASWGVRESQRSYVGTLLVALLTFVRAEFVCASRSILNRDSCPVSFSNLHSPPIAKRASSVVLQGRGSESIPRHKSDIGKTTSQRHGVYSKLTLAVDETRSRPSQPTADGAATY